MNEIDSAQSTQPFPDPSTIFAPAPPRLADAFPTCDVVLDTNALLLPYEIDTSRLQEIVPVFKRLIDESRLFVPAQVAREFAKNRPKLLGKIVDALAKSATGTRDPNTHSYPLLKETDEYRAFEGSRTALLNAMASYRGAVRDLVALIEGWEGSDPVLTEYSSLFSSPGVIEEPSLDLTVVREEFEIRSVSCIPPGYKDREKPENALGDFVIWKTILELGGKRRRPLVFVTNETKEDWVHRAGSHALMPRVELVDEYQRASGSAFYLVPLSGLLEVAGVDPDAVDELREVEDRERDTEAMEAWFFANYEDPANGVPYDGREGGYQYVHGGPVTALDALTDRFDGEYAPELIEELADSISFAHGEDWVSVHDY